MFAILNRERGEKNMNTKQLKPVSLFLYEYLDSFVIEIFSYDLEKGKEKNLQERLTFEKEEEIEIHMNRFRKKYDIKAFTCYKKEEQEVSYTPHKTFFTYEWTPKSLKLLLEDYFRREYGEILPVSVTFQLDREYFFVMVEIETNKKEKTWERVVEDFTYDGETFHPLNDSIEDVIYKRILEEVVEGKFVMVRLINQSFEEVNYEWTDDKEPAYFFFQ